MDSLEDWTEPELKDQLSRLSKLMEELEQSLLDSRDAAQTVDLEQPIGRLSRMDAIQQQKMVAAGRRNTELRLAQVRNALVLFERDEYGICRKCEEPIRKARLIARPESPFCIGCQQISERR